MATYITDAELLEAVAVRIGYTPDKITAESHLPAIVSDANLSAYQAIRSVLSGRGYSFDVIDSWERAAEYNRRIGICHALTEWALTKEVNSVALDRICQCEKELDDVIIVIPVEDVRAPDQPNIGYGAMTNSTDVFSTDMEL